jgi:hypothetical protein
VAQEKRASQPEFAPCLKIYVDKKWKITAFKVDAGAGFSPVRMSFKTERPFHPYREPSYQRKEGSNSNREFRLFFVGPWRAAGQIGEGKHRWAGMVECALPIAKMAKAQDYLLGGSLPSKAALPPLWVDHFC